MMRSISIEDHFSLSEDAMFRALDDGAVILDLHSGTYFGLNAVGTHIWQLIEQDGRLTTVLTELCREYDATQAELERDLIALVTGLAEAGLGNVT